MMEKLVNAELLKKRFVELTEEAEGECFHVEYICEIIDEISGAEVKNDGQQICNQCRSRRLGG